jgi:hypothetical protein
MFFEVLDEGQRSQAVCGCNYFMAGLFQHFLKQFAHIRVVFGNQQAVFIHNFQIGAAGVSLRLVDG